MAFSRMCHGVWKSGSPMPREITSLRPATMSKKSRMPDLGRLRTCGATKSWADLEAVVMGFTFHQDTLVLVRFQHEMGCGREYAVERGEARADEVGDFL